MSPALTLVVLTVIVVILVNGPAAVRKAGDRKPRVQTPGGDTPRRRAGAELHAVVLVDHEALGWLGATDGSPPSQHRSAPREAARFAPYALPITSTRRP